MIKKFTNPIVLVETNYIELEREKWLRNKIVISGCLKTGWL